MFTFKHWNIEYSPSIILPYTNNFRRTGCIAKIKTLIWKLRIFLGNSSQSGQTLCWIQVMESVFLGLVLFSYLFFNLICFRKELKWVIWLKLSAVMCLYETKMAAKITPPKRPRFYEIMFGAKWTYGTLTNCKVVPRPFQSGKLVLRESGEGKNEIVF